MMPTSAAPPSSLFACRPAPGARLGEVRTATFDQFNLDLAIWTKQVAYTKQRRIHRIPISPEARPRPGLFASGFMGEAKMNVHNLKNEIFKERADRSDEAGNHHEVCFAPVLC